jgi:hypothetical protein
MKQIKYKAGYKYVIAEDYGCQTSVRPGVLMSNDYLSLGAEGFLVVRKGYAFDGASGPAMDTPSFMRGALHHDALYQLMREGLLSDDFRKQADIELRKVCREDGMTKFRAWYVYNAVRMFGSSSAQKDGGRKILIAPQEVKYEVLFRED